MRVLFLVTDVRYFLSHRWHLAGVARESGCEVLAKLDGRILRCERGATTQGAVRRAVEAIERTGATLIETVLCGVQGTSRA